MRMTVTKSNGGRGVNEQQAVVIGAGMAGLVTARVLARRVDRVVVVDRDTLPDGPDGRKGVPQGRHAHGLLQSGADVLEDLFPGLMSELQAGGAQAVTGETARWWQCGGYRVAAEGAGGTFFSRPFLEFHVRRRLAALPNVAFLQAGVTGLVVEDGRVQGVVAADHGEVPAALVADSSGRSSQLTRWLAQNGFPEPPVGQIHIDMGYATRLYRRTPGLFPDGTWIISIGDPTVSKRLGVAFPIEGDRWIVTLAGVHGDHAPTDDIGFAAWADTLATADIAAIVRHEQPLGPAVTHRLVSDQWRHFEKLKRHPAGLVAIGDSICSFNPVYGQGMSSAALQAEALARTLDRTCLTSPALPGRFYKAAARVIARPWAIAAGGDFSFAETTGDRPPMVDLLNRYVTKAAIAAQHDPVVSKALNDVLNLVAAPPSLMRPTVMARVLRAAKKGPTGAPVAAGPRVDVVVEQTV